MVEDDCGTVVEGMDEDDCCGTIVIGLVEDDCGTRVMGLAEDDCGTRVMGLAEDAWDPMLSLEAEECNTAFLLVADTGSVLAERWLTTALSNTRNRD